ncbi:hypothetical protein B14911_03939 [Bacillus sp. NRRL B-14911]|nr:hypothetical protein B14911_03939 [Bacillus sp. NRRL B-14911]
MAEDWTAAQQKAVLIGRIVMLMSIKS